MGIQVWEPRETVTTEAPLVQEVPEEAPAPQFSAEANQSTAVKQASPENQVVTRGQDDVSQMDWEALQAKVENCTACDLHAGRVHTVFGTGNRNARLLLVGEAPGAEEDIQGEPFVGRAGKLLNEMLHAMGFERADIYIANILKCRPPNNRDPHIEEVVCCEPFLNRQVELIKPDVILALGRIAAQNLLKSDQPLARLRGQCHTYSYGNIPLYVTYHPAYLLRSPKEKRKAWVDLQRVMKLLTQ
jgi:DNA polymerase